MDSGCTGEAFLDSAFVKTHGILRTPLSHPKPLFLADGQLRDWIRETAILDLQIGAHRETISLFTTPLAEENPVILGIPWLQKPKPAVDWNTLDLKLENCGLRCLPPGAPTLAPRAMGNSPRTTEAAAHTNYRPAAVEDLEEDDRHDVALPHMAHKRAKRARQQRAKRRSASPRPLS